MTNIKRLVLATFFGVVFGLVCWILSSSSGPVAWYMAAATILGRTLIGFTIGISTLKMKWWLHGVLIGAVYSIPMALNGFFVPGREIFIFLGTTIMGVIYGFLIELLTTVVFKAPSE